MTNPTTPTPYAKFGFDTEFFELVQGPSGATTSVPVSANAQARAVEEAKQLGYGEGYTAGLAEGQAQAQTDLAQLQQHLQNTILALQTSQTQREEQLLTQMLSLMRVTVHQLMGHVAGNFGPELLEHHLRALLPLLAQDESLTLKIHPAARGFHEKLGLPQAAIMGLPMHIAADPSLGQTDAVIQWANGGVESKLAQHMASFDTLLAGAGAQILPVEHKTNLNPVPLAVPGTPVQAAAPVAAPTAAATSVEDEADKAAKARANALLGDDDGDLVDALK